MWRNVNRLEQTDCKPTPIALRDGIRAVAKSTYKKLAVQWLNEALCFVSSFVVADSSVLRNLLLRQVPNRYKQCYDRLRT
ncbi:hypothetical protein C8N25_1212 [Algoriphagus antarcticus]|uniref:Uncharacterized protein n=1 Tax=Algoriphagus antarcticus TaxID=238540 RepID=A0A3E0DID9_9BACT|nr:hypothetical protein C8N25_1212 [Algoriphagus antarcticus]